MCDIKLYRGFSANIVLDEIIENIHIHIPRNPRDTPLTVHNEADAWFHHNFGFRFRTQALFCTGSRTVAKQYGVPAVLEPIGENYMCWSPIIDDLYVHYLYAPKTATIPEILDKGQYVIFPFSDIDMLKRATSSGNEIMLWCRQFKILSVAS